MRRLAAALITLTAITFATPLMAASLGTYPTNVNDISDTPAATLLVPFFEVDLSNSQSWTTVFSVNNASATAALTKVTIWSDLSVPVLSFNMYLTGYDVQAVDLRAVLNGTLPQTASAGQDPTDTISPKGSHSQDINFASCTGVLPPAALPANIVTGIQQSLTGQQSSVSGKCSGLSYGDNIARGYVTIDNVTSCNTSTTPASPGYATNELYSGNILWGDFYFINASTNQARGNALIHVHASLTDPLTTTANKYTFYGRYNGWSAADHRGPLASQHLARYLNSVVYFPDGTELIAWRDTKINQAAFTCGSTPAWYPLPQNGIAVFDEQEHFTTYPTSPFFPPLPPPIPKPFKAATQVVKVNGPAMPTDFNRGFIWFDLNGAVTGDGGNPTSNPTSAQSVMIAVFNYIGHYSVGYRTMQLDNTSDPKTGYHPPLQP